MRYKRRYKAARDRKQSGYRSGLRLVDPRFAYPIRRLEARVLAARKTFDPDSIPRTRTRLRQELDPLPRVFACATGSLARTTDRTTG